MDFIQNEINYNLIILYIEDFIQYELELESGFGMSKKHELVELINRYKMQELFQYKVKNNYNFIPLKDIKRKKEVINRNGFIVYSKSKIIQTRNTPTPPHQTALHNLSGFPKHKTDT